MTVPLTSSLFAAPEAARESSTLTDQQTMAPHTPAPPPRSSDVSPADIEGHAKAFDKGLIRGRTPKEREESRLPKLSGRHIMTCPGRCDVPRWDVARRVRMACAH
jgi:hypothetical protein